MNKTLRQILCVLHFVLLLTACRQQQVSSRDITLDISVKGHLVGESNIIVSVRDKDGNSIENPGALALRGDMDHAGMAPVFAEASDATNGVFTLPFEWTMAGTWILEASLTLDSGEVVTDTFRYEILSQAGDQNSSDMDHSSGDARTMEGAGHSDMGGESSAVYLQIANMGRSAVIISGASSTVAQQVEFHRTVLENEIARMEPVESLVIPAGATLELRPGGLHIMLRQLRTDLKPGSSLDLHLVLATGEMIQLSIPIMNMLMDEDAAPTTVGDLVFSKLWARPANAGAPGDTVTEAVEPGTSE